VSRAITINCGMGESFGLYKMGDDAGIMPHITLANAGCGFHRPHGALYGMASRTESVAHAIYGDTASIIITREHAAVDPAPAASRTQRAIREGNVPSVNGEDVPVVESVCVHSDTPGTVAVAREVRRAFELHVA